RRVLFRSPSVRRSCTAWCQPVSRRTGVTASVTSSRISAQRPVRCVTSSIGLTPSPPAYASYASSAAGVRHSAHTSGLTTRRSTFGGTRSSRRRGRADARATRASRAASPAGAAPSPAPPARASRCTCSPRMPNRSSSPALARAAGRGRKGALALALEVLAQIHPRVQVRDLVRVAVEHEHLAAAELADAALALLAPARVVHLWVDVGVEPVLVRRRLHPGGAGL